MSSRAPCLRIVHCFRSPVGGIFRHVRDLVEAQARDGHLIGIVCDSSTGGDLEEDMFAGIRDKLKLGLKRVPMQRHIGIDDLVSAYRSYQALRDMKPDIVHGHGAKGGVYARVFGSILRLSGARVSRLYSAHGGTLHYDADTAVGKVFFLIERLLMRWTDHLLFVSDYERRTFREKIGEPTCASSLVYNGVQEAEFVPVETGPDCADFLYVGMMRDLKGPDIFIDALAQANRRASRLASAVMVGDGAGKAGYVEQAEKAGLGEQIRFLDPMPARKAFALGRIMVVPSRAEAMPYIVLEALAAGKTMIASRVGGIPEVFDSNSPALVNPNAEELAAKMLAVLEDEAGFAAEMPDSDTLHRRFSAMAMSRAITRVYDETHRIDAKVAESIHA